LVSYFVAGGYARAAVPRRSHQAPAVTLAMTEQLPMRLDRLQGIPDGRVGLPQRAAAIDPIEREVLKKGGVIDLHVDPPAERQASHALGHRATGE
jgi:hypothetical protein